MDPHRLAEERSLAYHRLVAEKMSTDESVIARAQRRVGEWRASEAVHQEYVEAWMRILELPREELTQALLDPGERGRALRQVTPFAGAIDPRTRWRIWREVRARSTP